MASELTDAFNKAQEHLATARRLVERAGEGNMTPGEMATLAQAHVFLGAGELLTAAFGSDFADEMEEEQSG